VPAFPWALIAASCFALFATSASGNTRAPFLLDMSRDLDVSLALAANLMAMNAITWGVASLLAGAWSDRVGRRPFLLGAPVALAGAMAGVAIADGYLAVAICVAMSGLAAGSLSATVATEVSSRVMDRQRGRALGWVLAGQSMAVLVGVPIAAALGEAIGWRGVHLAVAVLALAAATGLLLTTRRPAASAGGGAKRRVDYRAALTPRVLRLLTMAVAERSCYALAVTFFATYLQTAYDLPLSALAIPLALFALGNILGTVLGGQLADRLPDRLLTFAGALACAGAVALPLFLWPASVVATVALGFAFVLFTSIARPALMAALSNVPDEVRGTVLGLNVTSASFGWLGAAALGGLLMSQFGFAAFAPMAGGFAALGAALAVLSRRGG
jgi:predicted MFS family arabinose efflux permease